MREKFTRLAASLGRKELEEAAEMFLRELGSSAGGVSSSGAIERKSERMRSLGETLEGEEYRERSGDFESEEDYRVRREVREDGAFAIVERAVRVLTERAVQAARGGRGFEDGGRGGGVESGDGLGLFELPGGALSRAGSFDTRSHVKGGGGEETQSYPSPQGLSPQGLGAERLSEIMERDSRRYDSGFTRY